MHISIFFSNFAAQNCFYMKKSLLISAVVLLLSACNTCHVVTSSQIREIQFGRGGGFTNQKEVYSLSKKGELSKDGKLIKRVSCEDVERLFAIADSNNLYWFIEIKGKEPRKFVWGGSSKVDRKLKDLYIELNNLK